MALPSIKIQSLGAADQTNVPFTLGHVFAPGDMAAGRGLNARAADGSYLPLQVDQKATHADGSVRHAILSGILPALAAGETQSFQLLDADKRSTVQTFAGVPAYVSATIGGIIYTAVLDLLNDKSIWLTGPVVTERQSAAPFVSAAGEIHPHLVARFAVRDYGSAQRVDVTVENNWAYVPGPQNFTYDAAVFIGDAKVYSVANLTHLHHARWRKVFWSGAAPQINVQMDAAYLKASLSVPNFDPSVVMADSVLAAMAVDSKPMGIGLATAYMPTTGAHNDIGIIPAWSAAWVVSQDSRARQGMLATGDGAGSFSMHYRDKNTDRPISIKDFPYMTLVGNHGDTFNPVTKLYEAFPAPGGDTTSPYTNDVAHHPSLAFSPYLATGDYFYLEEMQFWASYVTLSPNPSYRGASQGIVQSDQLRGQAWALRTLFQAAAFTPDDHPLKADLLGFADNNLEWYNATYTNSPTSNKLGAILNGAAFSTDYNGGRAIAPWQDDFFTSVIGHGAELGFDKAKSLLTWKAQFPVGRMTAPGVCFITAAAYNLTLRDAATAASPIYDTFAKAYTTDLGADFMALTCGGQDMAMAWGRVTNLPTYPNDMGQLSSYVMGYPSNMQPALAYSVDSGAPSAKAAWNLFMSRAMKPDYSQGVQFAVVPRDYVAQAVAPIIDPAASEQWQQIATEGQTVTVPDNTEVSYGADTRWAKKVMSGAVTADNATFGFDPAPNVKKVLRKLISDTVTIPPIQPPQGDKMTYKLSVVLAMAAQQLDAQSQAAPTTIRGEVLTADGQTVVASVDNGPFEFPGLAEGDYVFRASGLDSNAVVMGVPFQVAFTANDVTAPPGDPAPGGTIDVQLPSGAALTLTREQ